MSQIRSLVLLMMMAIIMVVMMMLMMMLMMITIKIMNVAYIWITSNNAMQIMASLL